MLSRKSKVTDLFDQAAYKKAVQALAQNSESASAKKNLQTQNKLLQKFSDTLRTDLKKGTGALVQQAQQDPEQAQMAYFLFLDFFTTEQGGGSLLVLGSQPQLLKAFKQLKKTDRKTQISWGILHLDAGGQLYFEPEYQGRGVKVPELFNALRSSTIKSSLPGFWSKVKRNTLHLGAPVAAGQGGEANAEPTASDVHSPIYEQYQQLRAAWEQQPGSPPQAKALIHNLKALAPNLSKEYQQQGDSSLKEAYQTMGKEMQAFMQAVYQAAKAQLDGQQQDGAASEMPADAAQGQLTKIQELLQRLRPIAA